MSRLVSIDTINKISYFLTYHSSLFYISKLLYVTVSLYFLHSFSFSPLRRLVSQTKILGKYIVLVLISLLLYFFSFLCCGDQCTVFCIVSFDFNWSRSPKIPHPFALVCRYGLADIRILANATFQSPSSKQINFGSLTSKMLLVLSGNSTKLLWLGKERYKSSFILTFLSPTTVNRCLHNL